jgi:uridylate kinase
MGKGSGKYSRIVLKLSGEAFAQEGAFGLHEERLTFFATQIKGLLDHGVELALVVGAGNIARGAALVEKGIDGVTADQMGMLGTIFNGLALRDILAKHLSIERVVLMSALPISGVVNPVDVMQAREALSQKKVVIFAGGTGNPCVTTDTTASLRAVEVQADALFKATKVDGVYSEDPKKNKEAVRFDSLAYQALIEKQLGVMDLAAICMCRDYNLPVCVFDMEVPGILTKIIDGNGRHTLISNGE